jgi:transposase-like protein
MNEVMLLAYFWLNKIQWSAAVTMSGCAGKTVSKFYWLFRRLAASTLSEIDTVIGGTGIIVDVDETKLGRRKYNQGHRVDGVWVVVGVERTEQRRVFLVAVEDRSADTIRRVVGTHVAPGSIVHTDGWRGYMGIDEACSVIHRTVNHGVGFIDSTTGVHTNVVEGTNFALKYGIPVRSRVKDGIEDHLSEFVWRRQNEGRSLWEVFIEGMVEIQTDSD